MTSQGLRERVKKEGRETERMRKSRGQTYNRNRDTSREG